MKLTVTIGETLTIGSTPTLTPPWEYQISWIWQRQASIGSAAWTDISGTTNQTSFTPDTACSFRKIRVKWCHHGAPDGARVNAFSQEVMCTSGVIPVGGKWPLNTGNVYVAGHVTGTGEYGDGAYAPDGMNELGELYYILVAPRNITEMEDYHPASNEWWQLTPGRWGQSIPSDVDRGVLENKSYGRPFFELYKSMVPGLNFLKEDYVKPEYGNAGPNTAAREAAYGGGATPWYLPAQYELELLYKIFKPSIYQNVIKGFGINPILDPPETRDYENFDNRYPDTTENRPDQSEYRSFSGNGNNHFYGAFLAGNLDETRDTGYWMSTHEPGDTFTSQSHGKQSHMLKQLMFRNGDQNFKYAVAPQARDGGMLMRAIRREKFSALEEYFQNNP